MSEIVRLRMGSRNDRIVQACKNKGITMGELAELLGWYKGKLSRIVNLWVVATEDQKIQIAVILLEPIDYLFPETLDTAISEGVFRDREVKLDEPQLVSLTEARRQLVYDDAEMLDGIDRDLLVEKMPTILGAVLSRREKTVLEYRFGITDGMPHTLAATGELLDVTRNRVNQIEHKAIRKLRHYPQEVKALMAWL